MPVLPPQCPSMASAGLLENVALFFLSLCLQTACSHRAVLVFCRVALFLINSQGFYLLGMLAVTVICVTNYFFSLIFHFL